MGIGFTNPVTAKKMDIKKIYTMPFTIPLSMAAKKDSPKIY